MVSGNGNQLSGSLAESMADSIEKAIEEGLVPPFHVAVISSNGGMNYLRLDASEGLGDCTVLWEYDPEGLFKVPVHIFFVDINGKSFHAVLSN